MTTCKYLRLTVELEVNAVTCPGVWLPNKGDVLVRLWLMDGTARTVAVFPSFPLVYQQDFVFQKVFDCQRLPDLHALLAQEQVRAELQQLRSGHTTSLANFECSLLTLLFPEVADRPGLRCAEEVSLCMRPHFLFPGVLSPKLEISTKTIIEEHLCKTPRKYCINKTISSQSACAESRPGRTIHRLARQAHSSRTRTPPSIPVTRPCTKHRPPFVIRHVDKEEPFRASTVRSLPSSSPRSISSDNSCTEPCCRPQQRDRHAPFMKQHSKFCNCDLDCGCREVKESIQCTVCSLYRSYFGTSYPRHCHSGTCGDLEESLSMPFRTLDECGLCETPDDLCRCHWLAYDLSTSVSPLRDWCRNRKLQTSRRDGCH